MNEAPPADSASSELPPAARFARSGLIIALLCIGLCVWLVMQVGGHRKDDVEGREVSPNPITNLMARYTLGSMEFLRAAGSLTPEMTRQLSQSLKQQPAPHPVDKFRAEMLASLLENRWTNAAVMEPLAQQAPELRTDWDLISKCATEAASISAEDWQRFEARHGWLARPIRAQSLGYPEQDWLLITAEARSIVFVMGGAALIGLVLFVAGIVLLIRLLLRWRAGKTSVVMQGATTRQAHAYLEAFAIYLVGFILVSGAIGRFFPDIPKIAIYGSSLAFVFIAIWWPRWRGVDAGTWRETMGWHRGQGFFREAGIGLAGWIMGLPLLMLAASLAPMISRWTGTDPTHPIVHEMMAPGIGRWGIVLLAVVFAPLVEEAMFRGLLFPGLAAGKRWLLGLVVSAFIFAVIHPQGWAGVPAIMVIAGVLTTLRLLRGSIIASMTAHALNNGLVTIMLWFCV